MKIKHLLIGMLAVAAAVACKQDEPVETPKLDVDKTAVQVAATAGEASFSVTTNQDWTASPDADWVSVDPATGKGSEKAVTVKVTAEDNTSEEPRTAKITVKAGELTKTVAVTQAGATNTEPGPGPEPTEDTYILVGEAVGGWDVDANGVVLTLTDGYYVAKEVGVTANKGMHFTKNNKWEGNVKGLHGLIAPNEIGEVGTNDISLTEGGAFDVYLTEALDKFYFMTPGKTPEEAVEHVEITVSWGMMGMFVDNEWGTDVPMTYEGEWIVAKGAQFSQLTFKIRGNGNWNDATNIGVAPGSEKGVVNGKIAVVTAEYSKANHGADAADIKLNGEAGTYDVYFSFDKLEVYVMEQGFKPGEKDPQNPEPVEVTYTVVGTLKDINWDNANPAGLMVKEGDYYVGKNVPFVTAKTLYDGADQIEFKVVETGTWDGYAHAQKENENYVNGEIPVQAGGENIIVKGAEGNYDVYFDKANLKVWVMEAGFKPGEKEPVVPQPEPEYTLDGKQWLFSTYYILIDLGLYEEGAMVIALPAEDGSGFQCQKYGTYEIVKTDATSGKILFSEFVPTTEEFLDPVEFPYSDLSEEVVLVNAEVLLGDPTPMPFTVVPEPYEISFDNLGGGEPSGPVENGEYWFFNGEKVMAPLAEDATTGTLPAGNVISGASTEKNIFTLTYDPDMTYYTIQDSYGRYLGQTDETGNITVTSVLPTDETYAFYLWCIEPGYGDAGEAFDIYNAAYYYDLTYSATNDNWALVDGGYEFPATLPVLVKAENPVAEPEVPAGPVEATVAEFLAAAEDETVYQLTGVITSVANTTYGNFYLKDDTGEVYIYGLCSPEGATKYWAESGAKVGDTITVQTVRTSYNGSPQGKNAIFVSLVPCEPEPEPELPEGSVAASATFSALGYANAEVVDGVEIAIDENVKVVFKQGGASTAPAYYTSGEAIRMYQNGATLDVTASGKTITSIEITFSNNHYYVAADSGELTAEAPVRTWTGEAESVKFTSTGTDKSHRAYVSAIKVIYK